MSDLTSGGAIRGGQPIQPLNSAGVPAAPAAAAPQTAQAVPVATGVANLAVRLSENLLKLVQAVPLQGIVGPRSGAAQQSIRLDNGRALQIPIGILHEGERVTLLLSNPTAGAARAYLLERSGTALSPPVEILLLPTQHDSDAPSGLARQSAPSITDSDVDTGPIGPRLLARVVTSLGLPAASSAGPPGQAPLVEGSILILKLVDDGRDAPSSERPQHPLRGHVLAIQNGKAFVRTSIGDIQVTANGQSLRPGLELVFDIEEIRPPVDTKPAPVIRDPLERLIVELGKARQALGPAIDNLLARAAVPKVGDGAIEAMLRAIMGRKRGETSRILQFDLPSRLVAAGQTELSLRVRDAAPDSLRTDTSPAKDGEWRDYALPLMVNGEAVPLRLYRRRGRAASGPDAGGGSETRFILELSLSHFGPTQIDGLLHGQGLDLILRTTHPLPDQVMDALSGIIARVNETAETPARLQFRSESTFSVRPAEEMARRRPTAHLNVQS